MTPDELARLTQHPLGAQYRAFTQQEYDLLRESIRREGVQKPLLIYRGQVLDGWHRRRACIELGKSAPVEVLDERLPHIEASRRAYDANVPQRHLTPTQLAVWAARSYRLDQFSVTDCAQRMHNNGSQVGIVPDRSAQWAETAKERVAEQLGISKRQLERADRLVRQAPHLAQRVEDGQTSLRAAERQLAAPHVAKRTGNMEWYTPPHLLDAARELMGGIDLDPASCKIANENVQAERFFTQHDDGLAQHWSGRVWLNPPYARGITDRFVDKLIGHVRAGDVTSAVMLTNNATETEWGQRALRACAAACFVEGRVRFLRGRSRPEGTPLQGQMITVFGSIDRARLSVLERLGSVFAR